MAASDPFCLVCEQSHVVKPAVIWCNICEGLCEECSVVHRFIKDCSSPLHTTISVDNRKKLPTFIAEIKQICDDHSEPYVLYCSIHNEPCCSQCSSTKHSTCSGFRSLEVMTKNAADSASLTDVENGIDRLSKNCEIVRSNRETALTKYQDEVNSLKSSLKTLHDNMIKVFDQMEKDIIVKVDKIGKPYTEEMENITSVLTNLNLRLEDMRNGLTTMKLFGSSYQIFAGTGKLRTELDKEERILEALLIDGKVLRQKDITFKFEFASLPAVVKKAVNFETEETNCTLQLLRNQSIQIKLSW
ncbi:probable RING finger protein 207 homolog [Mytilus californianus]|uniref:probable RING finger protein 207 homolog n=1 Tax=Mytilus californianus TaxID=6549 RepID=UPI0022484905|nr:probable RING finger protein 207 homolog [Mytilus californianus]